MEGNLGPAEIRSRKFEMVRRGYDRSQVDRFRDEVAVSMAAVSTELTELREKLGQAGMADVPDLKTELDAVGSQISDILATANEAAEGMRTRASEDAARWRAEADKESRAQRSSSSQDAEQARRSAWETGTTLLQQAEAESKQILEESREDALFIRAEAEREALRLTGDARRDKEEAVRRARTEADRLLIEARAESERILESARQSAQNAQERARALEQRRSELMQELEAARLSIGQLEQEIDTRREALHAAADAPDAGVRVIKTGSDVRPEWQNDDARVRIVPASRVAAEEPIDPDAFVAEFEELRSTRDVEDAEDAESLPEDQPSDEDADDAVPDEPATVAEPAGSDAATSEPADEGDGDAPEEPVVEAPDEAPVEAAAEPAPAETPKSAVPEGIDDLFAELRTESPTPTAVSPAETTTDAPAVAVVTPAEEPAPAEAHTAEALAGDLSMDPFELRDRVLLPIENRTLRSVKRRVVDLQNRVLEELRVGEDDWEPDRSMFAAAVSDDIRRMNSESFVGGYAAAAELLGESATPPPGGPAGQETSGEFVDALVGAVIDALKRTRSSGGGSRQITAAVGRIFRAWRTDEAARRIRHAGYFSYNGGLLGAYAEMGVAAVVAVAPGEPCGECPAGTGVSWVPGRALPSGTAMPPVGSSCRATIVPAK